MGAHSVSNSFPVSAGVPQGGTSIPLCFLSLCINSLDSYLPPSVIPVKYADDLTITEFSNGIFTRTHSEGPWIL